MSTTTTTTEQWSTIEGFNKYEISNLGRVKSNVFSKSKILKSSPVGKKGNQYLATKLTQNGVTKSLIIHIEVAKAFLNHTPNGHKLVVDHIDADTTNNTVGNLQVLTNRENVSKGYRTKKTSSQYTGVSWEKANNKWSAAIRVDYVKRRLGLFVNEIDAHFAYEKALALVA
tara:strand:+ start:2094 stop:2606 length:513 start_codon:yes stop_codon:yes gene_type:complete